MSARQERVREALEAHRPDWHDEKIAAALAEVEEWEARSDLAEEWQREAAKFAARLEAAEAVLKAVAQAWFDFDQEALDTLLGPYREEEA